MRIERLALKGFLRFRDELVLDLRDVPAGLVAIVGSNGEGKTTLLEAPLAALYRSFPSREKELSAYATDRDSFIDLECAIDGRGLYHARVSVDGVKRGSDAVLEAVLPDGQRAVLNDGKVSTYDAAIAKTFPARELMLASAFAAQNKAGSFISLDKKTRKQLFMQLLGIERYQTMSDTARQAASFYEQALGRLRAVREVLARESADGVLDELDRLANALQADGGDADVRQRLLKQQLADLVAELDAVGVQQDAFTVATERLRAIDTDLGNRRGQLARVAVDSQAAVTTLTTDRNTLTAQRDKDLLDVQNRLANNEAIREKAAAIRDAVAAVARIEHDLTTVRADIDHEQVAQVTATRALAEAREILNVIYVAGGDLKRAHEGAALLTTVPCGGSGEFASCQFLTKAAAAKARIPALEDVVAGEVDAKRRVSDAEETINAIDARLRALQERRTALADEKASHEPTAKYAEALAAAEARVSELNDKRTHIEKTADAALTAAETRYLERRTAFAAQHQEVTDAIAQLDAERVAVQGQADANAHGHAQAVVLREKVAGTRVEWDAVTAQLARVDAGRQELQRRRAELTVKRAQVADLDGRIGTLETDLLDYQLLTKALGRDGLPVLEIDAAGPTISAYVNELLAVCFGTRFTVDLVTQQAKADGKGQKEDFAIRVYDNQRGGEPRDLLDLSGGEQVIVSEALMNAIAVYVNLRSSMPVRTCWRDETTGALDPENATRYLAMLRKVQELGGFHHVLFITHNPDAAALADAQVRVADGKVAIAQPPYTAQEAA